MSGEQFLPALLSSTIALVSIFGLSCNKKSDPGEAVIQQLKKAGASTSKLVEIVRHKGVDSNWPLPSRLGEMWLN